MAEKEKKQVNKWSFYEGGKTDKKTCPKCGPGVFMADHKNRTHCGKCGFSEFKQT